MKKIYISLLLIIGITSEAQVIFDYDEAGNQIYRGPTPPSGRMASNINSNLAEQIGNKIHVAPIPVKTALNIIMEKGVTDHIIKIELLPYNSFQIIESVDFLQSKKKNSYIFDMEKYPYGVYYLKFYLSDGSVYTKTITKTN